jgi:hypothetical protein
MPTKSALLRAGRASRRSAGHDARPTGARVGRADAVWRGLGAGGRGRRALARNEHLRGWSGGLGPAGVAPATVVNTATGQVPYGKGGAKTKGHQAWVYTFYLVFYVRVTDNAGDQWRVGVHAHVHVMPERKWNPMKGVWETKYKNVPGNTFVPGYDCWSTPTPATIVSKAPPYTGQPDGGTPNHTTFFEDQNRYPTKL